MCSFLLAEEAAYETSWTALRFSWQRSQTFLCKIYFDVLIGSKNYVIGRNKWTISKQTNTSSQIAVSCYFTALRTLSLTERLINRIYAYLFCTSRSRNINLTNMPCNDEGCSLGKGFRHYCVATARWDYPVRKHDLTKSPLTALIVLFLLRNPNKVWQLFY